MTRNNLMDVDSWGGRDEGFCQDRGTYFAALGWRIHTLIRRSNLDGNPHRRTAARGCGPNNECANTKASGGTLRRRGVLVWNPTSGPTDG